MTLVSPLTQTVATLDRLESLTRSMRKRTYDRHMDEARTTADVPYELADALLTLIEAMEPDRWDGSCAVAVAIECLQLAIAAEEDDEPGY